MMEPKRKKKQTASQHTAPAFEYMWNAYKKVREYESLKDQHTQYYYASPSVQKHLKKQIKIEKHEFGKSSQSRHLQDLSNTTNKKALYRRKRACRMANTSQIWSHSKSQSKKDSKFDVADLKIAPYSSGLKQSSKKKLSEFKQNMKANQKLKEEDNKFFMKTNICLAKLQKPQMKLIHTLQPLDWLMNKRFA